MKIRSKGETRGGIKIKIVIQKQKWDYIEEQSKVGDGRSFPFFPFSFLFLSKFLKFLFPFPFSFRAVSNS